MKVSGFTFVRNAVKYDYPITESIQSLLPLVDEYIVCVGNSEDDTLALLKSIDSPKLKMIHSLWDDSLREGGQVLAVETNKAKAAVATDSDWLFYLQGDECIHEQDYTTIHQAMLQYKDDRRVEGLLFRYHHFYGSYNYIGDSRRWYNREVRIIRNHPDIASWKDAQGFRIRGEKLKVKSINAFIYHYGWAKPPQFQKAKQKDFGKLWIKDETHIQNIRNFFDSLSESQLYQHNIESLKLFEGTHPKVMKNRIANEDLVFEFDIHKKHFSSFKNKFLYRLEKLTGKRFFEYRNYKII
jgi:hypothetical protein